MLYFVLQIWQIVAHIVALCFYWEVRCCSLNLRLTMCDNSFLLNSLLCVWVHDIKFLCGIVQLVRFCTLGLMQFYCWNNRGKRKGLDKANIIPIVTIALHISITNATVIMQTSKQRCIESVKYKCHRNSVILFSLLDVIMFAILIESNNSQSTVCLSKHTQ